jgi:hypothetical protein
MDPKLDLNTRSTAGFWHSRFAIGLIVIGAIAGYFLVTEHLAHVIGVLPYLLLLACPLMHVFMHGGHGSHGHGEGSGDSGHCSHGQHGDTKKPDEKSEPTDKGDRS